MFNSGAMNDVKLRLGKHETPSGELCTSIHEVKYPPESIVIHSNCKVGAFKVWAGYQYRPYDGEEFLVSCVIGLFCVC